MSDLAPWLMEVALNGWLAGLALAFLALCLRGLRVAPPRARHLAVLAAVALTAFLALVPVTGRWTAFWEGVDGGPPAASLEVPVPPGAGFESWVGPVWATVAGLLLLREGVGHVRLRRLRQSWRPVAPEVRRALAWPDRLPLVTGGAAGLATPLTVGLLWPAVFLPERALRELEPAETLAVARHELAHARWRDPATWALARVARIVLWPVAPLWALERLLHLEAEEAADTAAVAGASDRGRTEYARMLVAVARWRSALPRFVGAPGIAETALAVRVRRLLTPAPPRRIAGVAGAAALILTLVGLAGMPRFETRFGGPRAERAVSGTEKDNVRIVIPIRLVDTRTTTRRSVMVDRGERAQPEP
jgi:hypothetical protein